MPRVNNELPMRKVCHRLYEEDMRYCEEMALSNPELGVNFLIRRMVHTMVLQLKERERQKLDLLSPSTAINLEEFDLLKGETAE